MVYVCVVCVCRMVRGVVVCLVGWGYLFYVKSGLICVHQSYNLCNKNVLNHNNNNNVLFTQDSRFSYETALPAGPA